MRPGGGEETGDDAKMREMENEVSMLEEQEKCIDALRDAMGQRMAQGRASRVMRSQRMRSGRTRRGKNNATAPVPGEPSAPTGGGEQPQQDQQLPPEVIQALRQVGG